MPSGLVVNLKQATIPAVVLDEWCASLMDACCEATEGCLGHTHPASMFITFTGMVEPFAEGLQKRFSGPGVFTIADTLAYVSAFENKSYRMMRVGPVTQTMGGGSKREGSLYILADSQPIRAGTFNHVTITLGSITDEYSSLMATPMNGYSTAQPLIVFAGDAGFEYPQGPDTATFAGYFATPDTSMPGYMPGVQGGVTSELAKPFMLSPCTEFTFTVPCTNACISGADDTDGNGTANDWLSPSIWQSQAYDPCDSKSDCYPNTARIYSTSGASFTTHVHKQIFVFLWCYPSGINNTDKGDIGLGSSTTVPFSSVEITAASYVEFHERGNTTHVTWTPGFFVCPMTDTGTATYHTSRTYHWRSLVGVFNPLDYAGQESAFPYITVAAPDTYGVTQSGFITLSP